MRSSPLRLGPSTIAVALLALALAALPAPASAGGGKGKGKATSDPYIVGGTTTTIGAVPWQAAMVLDSSFGATDQVGCGGTFLTSRIVQTAAHCIFDTDPDCPGALCDTPFADPNDFDVIGGRTQLSNEGTGEQLNVQALYIHAGYNPTSKDNDLGWLVTTTPHSQSTVDVAGPSEAAFWDPDSPTMVSGWGHTSAGGSNSDIIKIATVPIIADSTCGTPSVYGGAFDPVTMVCAGVLSGGTDSCQGDSGGPLVGPSTTPGQVRLVGVVSFGIGCAGPNKPGVYARIASSTYNVQSFIDQIESLESLPDGGSVVGAGGLTPAPNPDTSTPTRKKKKCKKRSRRRASRGRGGGQEEEVQEEEEEVVAEEGAAA